MAVRVCRIQSMISGWARSILKPCADYSRAASSNVRYYNSTERQQYFTHRTHKRRCPSCGKPNLLTIESCTFCAERLTDASIGAVERDAMHDVCVTGKGLGKVLKWRFDFVVCENPYPIAKRHLLAIPKGTFSDIRRLRRNSLKILEKTKSGGLDALDECDRPHSIVGFSHPAEYNQVHLHIVVPPITNFLLFRASHWHPYSRVVEDINLLGIYRIKNSAKDPLEIDPWVINKDWTVRNASSQKPPRNPLTLA